ncbi:MAG: hypothetical protein TR69_WS6001000777 [candidate division WS6 bacterium OLB20]|uniref:LiaI-LiaF-like transmembrane region domain-containing protein n=1 Tax=candidate division WS6 bacterium OLB20 TaxID=1617426 RepID=A0A136LYM4_9BACT|nr:MAG: hypothetical protein TR69_WS6001000777 [candidate division WS6 bacterium OLB20]
MKEPQRVSNFTFFSDGTDQGEKLPDRIFGALWLISLGSVFFMNTTGMLPWSIWGAVFMVFFRLWPLFLIGAGVSIIAGNSIPAKIVTGLLWYLVFVVIFFFCSNRSQ